MRSPSPAFTTAASWLASSDLTAALNEAGSAAMLASTLPTASASLSPVIRLL